MNLTDSLHNQVGITFQMKCPAKRIKKDDSGELQAYRSANPKDYSDILVLNRNMHQETKVTTRAITVAVSISIQIRHSGACSK